MHHGYCFQNRFKHTCSSNAFFKSKIVEGVNFYVNKLIKAEAESFLESFFLDYPIYLSIYISISIYLSIYLYLYLFLYPYLSTKFRQPKHVGMG